MLATQHAVVIGTSKPSTTSSSQSDEPLIKDVTAEILGERREEWRDGFDAGVKVGSRRILESPTLEQMAAELLLLRDVAERLGKKADYWMRKSDEFEAEATHWHGVAAGRA